MYTWLNAFVRQTLDRYLDDSGDAVIIAIIVFILILMLAGRRVVVQ